MIKSCLFNETCNSFHTFTGIPPPLTPTPSKKKKKKITLKTKDLSKGWLQGNGGSFPYQLCLEDKNI